jgi:hypothetical protein
LEWDLIQTTTNGTNTGASSSSSLQNLVQGAKGLVHEAMIVSLIGICNERVSYSYCHQEEEEARRCCGYFILFQDVHSETLQDRLEQWRKNSTTPIQQLL